MGERDFKRLLRPANALQTSGALGDIGSAALFFASFARVMETLGTLWPTNPPVVPQNVYRGTELLLPFQITNASDCSRSTMQ
jgi:hypothetical protein